MIRRDADTKSLVARDKLNFFWNKLGNVGDTSYGEADTTSIRDVASVCMDYVGTGTELILTAFQSQQIFIAHIEMVRKIISRQDF